MVYEIWLQRKKKKNIRVCGKSSIPLGCLFVFKLVKTFVSIVGTEWRKYPAELVGLYLKYIYTFIVFILFNKFLHTFSDFSKRLE